MDEYLDQNFLEERKPTIKQVSLLYLFTIILFLFVGSRVQHNEFYSGILITEFILVMVPAIIMLFIYKYDFRYVLRLNRVSILNLFIILCIMIFTIPVVGVLNLVNLSLIKQLFGRVLIQQPPVAKDSLGLLVNVLVIGGSAGICEELLFRGVIQRGFEKAGIVKAILISSFLFGLMHVDFQKLLGTFLLGALIGFIVYRTNSIFAGMFAHFCNNSLAVVIAYASSKLMDIMQSSGLNNGNAYTADTDFSSLFDMPTMQLVAVIVVWGFIFVICAAVLAGLIIALIRNTENRVERIPKIIGLKRLRDALWLVPPILVIAFIYLAQGLSLAGVKVGVLDTVLKIIGIR